MAFSYVEDLLNHIGTLPQEKKVMIPPQDRGILFSIVKQLSRSLSLTERQGDLVLKIIKNIDFLYSDRDIKFLIDFPKYRYPFRIIDRSKIIDIIEVPSSKNKKKYISVKFPFDLLISKTFSNIGLKKDFDPNSRSHFVNLSVENLIKVYTVGKEFDFKISEEIENYVNEITQIKNNTQNFIPMIDLYNDQFCLQNDNKSLSEYFEKNKNGDFLHDLFLGKILNLSLSDAVKSALSSKKCDILTKRIINSGLNKNTFCLTPSSSFNLFNVTAFFKDVKNYPVLISLPDNENTVTLLNQWLIALNKNGVENKEISFLFRSPKNKNLNDTIKEKSINNLINNETKIVFINHKIPKTLYKLNFKTNILILNENIFGHYTLQKMIDSNPIILYYCNNLPKHSGKKIIEL